MAKTSPTPPDQYSGGARVAYLGVENQRFELAAGRVMPFDAERPDGSFVNSGNSARLSRYYNPQAFDYLHARHVARQVGPFDRVQTTLWAHESRKHQVREDLEGTSAATRYRRRVDDDRVRTLGVDVQLTNVIASHRVTYGATAYRDVIGTGYGRWRSPAGNTNSAAAMQDQTDGSNPGQTTVPDGSMFRGLGLFAQDSWQVHKDWELLGGLRFDRYGWNTHVTADRAGYASYGTTTVSDHAQALTAQARAAWHPLPEGTLYAGIGQGFRAATISDLAGIQDRASSSSGGTGPQTTGNPKLKPERSLTIETGAKWQDGYDNASVGVFRTALRDLIQTVYTDVNGDGQITAADRAEAVNANDGVLQGFELANDLGLPVRRTLRLSFYQATSLVSGEADVPQANLTTRREHISRANQLFGYAGIKFADVRQWYGAVQMRWSDAYDEPAPSDATDTRQTSVGRADGSMPGWAVADLKAGWHTPDRRYSVDLTLENLFDVTYRAVGSGVDGAGFNIVLGGAARF